MLAIILIGLKILSTALTGVFGILGTIHECKDKDTGELTRWGKWAIRGIAISASIALVTQIVETIMANDSAQKEREVIAGLIKRVDRNFRSFDEMSLHLSGTYLATVEYKREIDLINSDPEMALEEIEGSYVSSMSADEEILSISWPIGVVIEPQVSVYKEHIDAFDFTPAIYTGGANQPDWQLNCLYGGDGSHAMLTYHIDDGVLRWDVSGSNSMKFWITNGRVRSIDDLAGAQMWFYVRLDRARYASKFELQQVVMDINGMEFIVPAEKLATPNEDTQHVAVVTMPDSLEKILTDFVFNRKSRQD